MKSLLCSLLITLLLPLLLTAKPQSSSADKKKLQNKFNELLKDIKEIETSLKETSSKKMESLNQLQSITAKIDKREKLIKNINEQALILDQDIMSKNNDISIMSKDISILKKEYAKILVYAYKNTYATNSWQYILAASSLDDAYNRYLYLKRYSEYREKQVNIIMHSISDLNNKVKELNVVKSEKTDMLSKEKDQQAKLVVEKATKDQLIAKLSKDESNLKAQVNKKNQEARDLNNQIQKIIEREIAEAKKRADLEAKKRANLEAKAKAANKANTTIPNKTTTTTPPPPKKTADEELGLTPAEASLSRDFASNYGRLPWPVEKGFVISKFGKHLHPYANVYVENNGVDIKTSSGATVRALFEGSVLSVFYMPFNQNSIILKHGEYFTVYSNMKTVAVKVSNKIVTKQPIGNAYTNAEDGITMVHLEIWKGKVKLDPQTWLAGGG